MDIPLALLRQSESYYESPIYFRKAMPVMEYHYGKQLRY